MEDKLVGFAGGSDGGCVTEEEESRRIARFLVATAVPLTEMGSLWKSSTLGAERIRSLVWPLLFCP